MNLLLLAVLLLIGNICEGRINFVHIPKTGGTTMRKLLFDNFPNDQIYPMGKIGTIRGPKALCTNHEEMESVCNRCPDIKHALVWGHFPMWFFKMKDPTYETSYFFTVLRDPVERVLSHSRDWLRNAINAGQPAVLDPFEIPPNIICKMLCTDASLVGDELIADCIKTLERMDFIIFMDDFDRGVKLVFEELGLYLPEQIPQHNSTVKTAVSKEIIEQIKVLNASDVKLYEYAIEHFRYKSMKKH